MGDDGLGPYIVENLRDIVGKLETDVRIMSLPQLDMILISEIYKVDTVIFVDARKDENEELVTIKQLKPAPDPISVYHTSHILSIPVLLRISLEWYGNVPECYAVMPRGYDFSLRETISDEARITAELAKNEIINIIQ